MDDIEGGQQTTSLQMDNTDGNSEGESEVLDSRIQSELDNLNVASAEINRLENELDEARSKYRSIISETSNRMEVILRDRKRSIQKSREYYKLMGEAKIAQAEALKAARQFQTATTIYKAAKETVALAECRLVEDAETSAAQLTSAWQEMLNHAISKVTVAEREKTKSEQEHKKRAAKFAELESRIQVLEKKFARSIKKSRPFFELKAELDIKLMQQKQNVNDLTAAIKSNKRKYTETLQKLERISEEIHQSRHDKFWSKVQRMPGVGAETDSIASSISELGKESLGYESDLESQLDTESINKSEIDLPLNFELGGQILAADTATVYENIGDLNKTLIGETNDLDTMAGAGSSTGVNVITVTDYDKNSTAKNSSTEACGVELNISSEACGVELNKSSEACGVELNISSEARGVELNKSNDTDKVHASAVSSDSVIKPNGGDDSEGEFTESFESCHEEQVGSPGKDSIFTHSNIAFELSGKTKTEYEENSTDGSASPDNVAEKTKKDMATVERPSISGAED